jgi:hypothetical protein
MNEAMNNNLNELIEDISIKQKKGLPFIVASSCIWLIITIIALTSIEQIQKNILILSCGALMFPLSIFWSKILKVNLFYKENPLINGILIATNNQILYLIICIMTMIKAPELVLPCYAIIYGGHLLPYSFLYNSKAYKLISICICFTIFISLVFLRLNVIVVPIIVEIGVLILLFLLKKERK